MAKYTTGKAIKVAQTLPPTASGPVLVVENDPDVRTSITLVLQAGGYRAIEAKGLEHAAAILTQENVALILLDYGAPDGTGMWLLDQTADALPPVILMSASGEVPVADPRVEAFLSKPFQPGVLLAHVSLHLGGSGANDVGSPVGNNGLARSSSDGLSATALLSPHLGSNRRTSPSGSLLRCRMCYGPIAIDASNVEVTSQQIYFRCPDCGHSFPIRYNDVPMADSANQAEEGYN